jgi:hypothetical protein
MRIHMSGFRSFHHFLCVTIFFVCCLTSLVATAQSSEQWCSKDSTKLDHFGQNEGWSKLPGSFVHLVAASNQERAIDELKRMSFLRLAASAASNLVGVELTPKAGAVYLVRTGSLYLSPADVGGHSLESTPFDVYYNKALKSLVVINPALGSGATRAYNLAAVVETPGELESSAAYCVQIAR